MDNCSYFIKDKALFGSYPSKDNIEELEKLGVQYFIDLTNSNEKKITKYTTNKRYLNFPMEDHKAPTDWILFARFLIDVCDVIRNLEESERILIHCKAGLGRSGLVVASILCYYSKMSPDEALDFTTDCYKRRPKRSEKLIECLSPNTYAQRSFIYKFFKPLYFYKAFKTGYTMGLSNFSLHSVSIPDVGLFPTAEAAFQSTKNPDDATYVLKLQKSVNPSVAKRLGKFVEVTEEWDQDKIETMKRILFLKFKQNDDARNNLLSTGLRSIIDNNKNDSFWGVGLNNEGLNNQGKILEEIRLYYLLKY